jgi:hypothetical protein
MQSLSALATSALRFAWVLPLLFLAAMRWAFGLDFPMLDQWELPHTLERAQAEGWSVALLFEQHNEHRPALPRVVMLALVWWTDWDVRAETMFTFLLGLLLFAVLAGQAHARLECVPAARRRVTLLAISTLMFSLAAYTNWFLGWQLQLMLSVLLAVLTLRALTHAELHGDRFGFALAVALLNTFTFANALLVWPLGLVVLAARSLPKEITRWRYATAWGVAGAVCVVLYFGSYDSPPHHAGGGSAVAGPIATVAYALAYLGAPLAFWTPLAVLAGMCGCVMLAVMMRCDIGRSARGDARPTGGALLARVGRAYPRAVFAQPDAFWWALVLYAVGSAVLTAFARQDQGLEQALSSRYATIAALFWVAVVVLVVARFRRGAWVAVIAIGLLAGATSLHGAYRWTERWSAYGSARPSLYRVEPGPGLHYVYPPSEQELLRRAAWLREQGLSIWRE